MALEVLNSSISGEAISFWAVSLQTGYNVMVSIICYFYIALHVARFLYNS